MNKVLRIGDTTIVVFSDEFFCPKTFRLIAAAPELLAACKAVIAAANLQLDADDPNEPNAIEISRTTLQQVIEAYGKAIQP